LQIWIAYRPKNNKNGGYVIAKKAGRKECSAKLIVLKYYCSGGFVFL
jgi:hypothetical protein